MTHLAIKDIPSGVEDGGVVHNLYVSWDQFLREVELWTFSQLGYSPTALHSLLTALSPSKWSINIPIVNQESDISTFLTPMCHSNK